MDFRNPVGKDVIDIFQLAAIPLMDKEVQPALSYSRAFIGYLKVLSQKNMLFPLKRSHMHTPLAHGPSVFIYRHRVSGFL